MSGARDRRSAQRAVTADLLRCPYCQGPLHELPGDAASAAGRATAARQAPATGPALACAPCGRRYPAGRDYRRFLERADLQGSNRRHALLNDLLSYVYTPCIRLAFLACGGEEVARSECLAGLEIAPGARVLEVGVGTGDNLLHIVRREPRCELHAVDIAPAMLRRCARNMRRANVTAELYLAEAEHLPFPDRAFDVVYHVGAVNFFSDARRGIEEMARVARPGTSVAIADENERALRALDKVGLRWFVGAREPVRPPLDLVPPDASDVRLTEIWGGYGYRIDFRVASR